MIVAKNLTKHYGSALALDNVSFTIQPGESVALWGANGAGKTTALRCLLGVLPFEGELTVNGIDVRQQGKAVRGMIGYVPQEVTFYDLTVWETLQFYARLKKVSLDRIEGALQQVQLADQKKKAVRALSGGMKQRIALAVGLLSDPPVLMLDEPTANLDVQAQRDFIQTIQGLNQAGKTVVFSSHRLDEVVALGQRALVLSDGHLELDCNSVELADKLGLRQWLCIRVPDISHEDARRVLEAQGFTSVPNGQMVYVHTDVAGKMAPLRALESAQIPVEDFDLVDSNMLPQRGEDD